MEACIKTHGVYSELQGQYVYSSYMNNLSIYLCTNMKLAICTVAINAELRTCSHYDIHKNTMRCNLHSDRLRHTHTSLQ